MHTSYSVLQEGGAFLGAARRWIQHNALNGDSVIWGSYDFLKMGPKTVKDIEVFAATVVASDRNERKKIVIVLKPNGMIDEVFSTYDNDVRIVIGNDNFEYRAKTEGLKKQEIK